MKKGLREKRYRRMENGRRRCRTGRKIASEEKRIGNKATKKNARGKENRKCKIEGVKEKKERK